MYSQTFFCSDCYTQFDTAQTNPYISYCMPCMIKKMAKEGSSFIDKLLYEIERNIQNHMMTERWFQPGDALDSFETQKKFVIGASKAMAKDVMGFLIDFIMYVNKQNKNEGQSQSNMTFIGNQLPKNVKEIVDFYKGYEKEIAAMTSEFNEKIRKDMINKINYVEEDINNQVNQQLGKLYNWAEGELVTVHKNIMNAHTCLACKKELFPQEEMEKIVIKKSDSP